MPHRIVSHRTVSRKTLPFRPVIAVPLAGLALAATWSLASARSVHAQEPYVVRGAERSEPVFAARSELPATAAALRRPAWQPGDPIREIPRRTPGWEAPKLERSPRIQIGRDQLAELQKPAQNDAVRGAVNGFTVPVASFAGQGFMGSVPPDTVGASGRDHFVQAVNNYDSGTSVQIYELDGTPALDFILADLAPEGTACRTDGGGDPNVLYDGLAGRWVLSEFTWGERLCVYVSMGQSPLGSFWVYEFTAPEFPDYPKFAVWPDGYYAGTNESDPALYVFEREAMLSGNPATFQRLVLEFADQLPAFVFEMLAPGGVAGGAPPPDGSPAYFLRHNDDELHSPGSAEAAEDYVELFEFAVDWTTPANTTLTGPFSIAVTDFDSDLCESNETQGPPAISPFECILQPSTQRLDAVREVVMFPAQYRNFGSHQTLVGSLSVDVDGNDVAASRWFELRRIGGGAWGLHQEGTYGPNDGTSRWMSSIGVDVAGNIALGYNVANGSDVFPGLRYTGRTADAPLNQMNMPETELAEGTAANASRRYGDYTSMSLGTSGCTFWYTGEYNLGTTWSTWIGSFLFDDCLPIFADDFEAGFDPGWVVVGEGFSPDIFSDDFESGNTDLWSAVGP